jgi:uncharacterized protein
VSQKTISHLIEGLRLYDKGRFFEAHEVWELAWLEESDSAKNLLQSLILIAAARIKSRAKNFSASRSLLVNSLKKLSHIEESTCLGFPTQTLRNQVEAVLLKVKGESDWDLNLSLLRIAE